MANNFDSNITRKVARFFLEGFESTRVLSKNVNTQLLNGRFNPTSGEFVDFKRPTDYKTNRTANGDVSALTADDIKAGKATGTVQDYFTTFVNFDEADEAIKMDQLDELLSPMSTRIVTDLELDFAGYMMKNAGLLAGNPGTAVTTWDHVAEAGAVMSSAGIPKDGDWYYTVNPYTQTSLASNQRSLGAGGAAGTIINEAHRMATISSGFAGMNVMTATTLDSFTTPATGDLAGTVNGAPDPTYVGAKDSMTQSITVAGIGSFSGVIPAGTTVRVTGVNRLNMSTRKPVINGAGANVEWTGVLTAPSALSGGAGIFVVSGPAIYEAAGAFNTVDSAIANGAVITILNADSTLFQPNLFFHKQAYAIGSVPIKKLYSTDTIATTKDGLQFRISKGAGFLENRQDIRIDFRPAYAVLNPFFAGQGYGS
tara:strand:- start:625 stop:1902 length:1278 start_codon:yes stop_codon:yes gene_type:complete